MRQRGNEVTMSMYDVDEMDSREKKKFELANQDRVKSLDVAMDTLLQELDCEGALVTDESELYDFMGFFMDNSEREQVLEDLRKRLGVEIMDELELMVDIAQRIKDKKAN